MTQPGTPAAAMPADESSTLRRLADLERQMRELGPSVAASFNSTVAKVVRFDAVHASTQGFTPTTSYVTVASATAETPEGFNSATVLVIANSSLFNPGVSTFMQVRATLGDLAGASSVVSLGNNQASQSMGSRRFTLSVTSGEIITVGVQVRVEAAIPAQASNIAYVDAILLFRKT